MVWCFERGRKVLAHRYSYEVFSGPIPPGGLILHSCDNPACVNPAHLRVGSYKANVADMDARKRRVSNPARGAANHNAQHSDTIIIAVRSDYVQGVPLDEISATYNIPRATLPDYTGGRAWKHLLGIDGCPTLEELKSEGKKRRRNGAKITQAIADTIRKRIANGETGRALALEFGIHFATVSDIKHGRVWSS